MLTDEERDDLCDAVMSYQRRLPGNAPEKFEQTIVPVVEAILAARACTSGGKCVLKMRSVEDPDFVMEV